MFCMLNMEIIYPYCSYELKISIKSTEIKQCFFAHIDYSAYASIMELGIRQLPQTYRGSRAGQIVFANFKRIVTQRGKVNDIKSIKTMNILTATQVGGHSVYKCIKLGRINSNHVINPNVVNCTSGPDATRYRTECVNSSKCYLRNARSIINKTNI